MATPLKVLTALSASYGAAVSGSEGLQVQQGGIRVTSGVISGSSDLQVGGNATVAGNLTLTGDLTVNGTTTTINSTTLTVDDKNIVLAQGAVNDAAADGGGITLESGGGNKTFNWLDATDSWTSSENMDLAASKAYKLTGVDVLNNGNVDPVGAGALTQFKVNKLVSGSDATGFVGVGTGVGVGVTGRAGVILSGSTDLFAQAGSTIQLKTANVYVTGAMTTNSTLRVQGASTLVGVVTAPTVTSSVGVSASVFVLADGTQLTSSTQFGGGGGGGGDATKSGINSEYNSLRLVLSGTLNGSGHADIDLTALNATNFGVASLHSCSVDVMTDADGTGWTNDLVSVRLEVSSSALYVKIDAPAAPSAGYRLIAVNESDFNLV